MSNLANRLGTFFRRFKRDRREEPVHLNFADATSAPEDADALSELATATLPIDADDPDSGPIEFEHDEGDAHSHDNDHAKSNGNGNGNGNGHGRFSLIRPKTPREATLSRLERGYEEVVELMQAVRGHMADQSERGERLLTLLEGLPEALRGLPESSRRQSQMLETVQVTLEQQGKSSRELTQAIAGLSQATSHHDAAMNAMQQQLASQQENDQLMLGSFKQLNGTLAQVGESSQAGAEMLRHMAEHTRQSDAQMRELVAGGQKHMPVLTPGAGGLA